MIEGIEEQPPLEIKIKEKNYKVGGHPNCWGMQFHPEYLDLTKTPEEARQLKIIKVFKTASLAYQLKKETAKEIIHLFKHKAPLLIKDDIPVEAQSIKKASAKLKHSY